MRFVSPAPHNTTKLHYRIRRRWAPPPPFPTQFSSLVDATSRRIGNPGADIIGEANHADRLPDTWGRFKRKTSMAKVERRGKKINNGELQGEQEKALGGRECDVPRQIRGVTPRYRPLMPDSRYMYESVLNTYDRISATPSVITSTKQLSESKSSLYYGRFDVTSLGGGLLVHRLHLCHHPLTR
jgi:hypothetical protein